MDHVIEGVTGVLLAGGKSRRMGSDKRFLDLNGATLFARVLQALDGLFQEVIVVIAESIVEISDARHRVVKDLIPDCGSLGGLYTGLSYASKQRVFAVACDMPFLNREMIHYMTTVDRSRDIVMAQLKGGLQPMHAVYSKECLPLLERMARTRRLKIQDLASDPNLSVRFLPEDSLIPFDPLLLSFHNINTPADFELAKNLLLERKTSERNED